MKESIFQTEWRKSILHTFPSHYIKIPDPASKFNQTIKRPYDCYTVFCGNFYAFELKQIKEYKPFPFEKLEPHQEYYLNEVSACGGMGYVVINYRYNYNDKKNNIVYAINIDDYNIIKDYFVRHECKSISVDFMAKSNFVLKIHWMKEESMWDVCRILCTG